MYNMSEACCNINVTVVRLQLVSVGESRGCCTLMVRGPHQARLPSRVVVWMAVNHSPAHLANVHFGTRTTQDLVCHTSSLL